ncbi:hypothetical protein [Glycomyces sp. NRRL B-16210]|uniref:hypothetical protein n=1 Tax=Glycomyces sp. NRRL B-16210 TaxID=1463821 RepID=UPI0004C1A70C|nr:hypothetical protein [Glycomyces sp. NRRL B-16210]
MTPETLQHSHLAALITGDLAEAEKLRELFHESDRAYAVELLRAATAVCLEYRFGPGAGSGAGPVDHDELTEFMAEVRAEGNGVGPPPNYLDIEAVIRSLYGEGHLLAPLDEDRRSQALWHALRHQVSRYRWIKTHPDQTIDRAKQLTATTRNLD